MRPILLTGGTGNIGRHLVPAMVLAGAPVRVLTRDPSRARALFGGGVAYFEGDLARPGDALADVETALLLGSVHAGMLDEQNAFVDAAAAAGVERIVKLSSAGAQVGSPISIADWHGRNERRLQGSGLRWTILQPGAFLENLFRSAANIRAGGLPTNAGESPSAYVAARDVAAVAATVLLDARWDGQIVPITGPAAVTVAYLTASISAAAGHPVVPTHLSDDAMRNDLVAAGVPDFLARDLVAIAASLRDGPASPLADASTITGKPATTVLEWCHANANAFRAVPAR